MAKNRLTVKFDGFEETFERLDKLGANVKKITEDALNESFDYVTQKAKTVINKHYLTGATERSLKKTPVINWEGARAEAKVGFNISNGGIASIFLMYGTPKMSPDRSLYNAFYGAATKKKVKAIQEKVFKAEVEKYI